VHRHRRARLQQAQRPRRALRVEVAGGYAPPPARHRQQRDVEARRDVGHRGEDVGVAGVVRGAVATDDVPERMRAPLDARPPGGMDGRGRAHRRAPDRRFVAGGQLDDVAEAAPAEPAPRARRRDDRGRVERAQRRQVEVVVVHVRDQHGVDALRQRRHRHDAPEHADAPPQHRIGQQPRAAELDQDRAVPEPDDAHRAARMAAPSAPRLIPSGRWTPGRPVLSFACNRSTTANDKREDDPNGFALGCR